MIRLRTPHTCCTYGQSPAGRVASLARLVSLALVMLPAASSSGIAQAGVGDAAPRAARAAAERMPAVGSITGVVVDTATGLPVTAAQVRLTEVHRAVLTHEDGRFAFTGVAAGSYTLSVQRLGYRLRTLPVRVGDGEVLDLRVTLRASPIELARSVVTGSIGERRGDEVLSPTSVLAGAELDRRLAETLAASLRSQPGVSVSSISPSTARPVIRGMGGDRILVLEDGQRPGDLSAMSGDHAVTIDPLNAQQIEVVRGPMSLLYGSSALGGVVNVVREEVPTSIPDRLHGAVNAQGGSVNRGGSVGGVASIGLGGHAALRLEGSARGAGDTRTPVGRLVNTGVDEYALSAGASAIGAWGHLGGAYRFYANDYGIPGGFVGGHDRGVDITMRRHTLRADGDVHLRRGPLASVRATTTYSDYGHSEFEPSGALGTRFDQALWSGEVVARHDSAGRITQGAIGARAQYRDLRTGGSLNTPSTYDWSLAGFVVEELGRGPLRLQAGGRYDWARYTPREAAFIDVGGERIPVRERSFGSVSGSLGALLEVVPGVRLGASLNRAYRTPDLNELYSNGPHLAANVFNVGDPSLREETGLGVDGFVRISRRTLDAEVAAFSNSLDDFIFESSRGRTELGSQGGRPRFQFTNESARFSGAEGRLDWNLARDVVVDASASYVRARFTSVRDSIPVITATDTNFIAAAEQPPFIPPLNGQLGVRWDRTRWFAGTNMRYAVRQARLGDFESPTAGYALLNLTAGLRLVVRSQLHSFTLRVENLFDREYREHLSRIKEVMPGPGRNFTLLYRVSF